MRLAARSRQGASRGGRARFHAAGGALGVLFARSSERADGIYRAMLARGFQGRFPLGAPHDFSIRDGLFLASAAAVCVATRVRLFKMNDNVVEVHGLSYRYRGWNVQALHGVRFLPAKPTRSEARCSARTAQEKPRFKFCTSTDCWKARAPSTFAGSGSPETTSPRLAPRWDWFSRTPTNSSSCPRS